MATTVTCAFAAPAAHADTCWYKTDDNNAITAGGLLDSAGFTWDFAADPDPSYFAVAGDGWIEKPEQDFYAGDSYDGFGGVSINSPALNESPDGGATYPNGYVSPDIEGCATEAGGRQIAFPVANVQGVDVQRRWYVPATGPRGARLLTTVRNPSDQAKTISVYVHGNMGSDSRTRLVGDSGQDGAWTASDRWAITADRPVEDVGTFSDPVVSHLLDGADGADRVDEVAYANSEDDILMAWKDITLAPGEQTSILSYEALTAMPDAAQNTLPAPRASKADEIAAANSIIRELDGLSPADRFAGLTAAQIASVRNWQRPATTASISGPASVTEGDAARFTAEVSGTVPVCTTSHAWQVDGQDAGSEAALQRALTPGQHTIKLTASSACGTSAVATKTVDVAPRPASSDTIAPQGLTLGGIKPGAKFRLARPALRGKAGTAPGDAKTVTLSIYQVGSKPKKSAKAAATPRTLVESQQVPVVNGAWSTKPLAPLVPGRYDVVASQADAAGNVTRSRAIPFRVLGSCESRRAFDLHLLKAKDGYKRVKVTLNGKSLKVRGKRAPEVRVNLKGLPKGKQTVRVSATTAGGRKLSSVRVFRTCAGALR